MRESLYTAIRYKNVWFKSSARLAVPRKAPINGGIPQTANRWAAASHIEAEEHHVAVAHNVILALAADQSGLLRGIE